MVPCLPGILYGLVPEFPVPGMVRELFDLVDESGGVEGFEALDHPGMQGPPSLMEEAAVDDLMRQGMLKGVHRLEKGLLLIEDLGMLEYTEVLMESGFRTLPDRP
jgi:hypothetical protein